MLGERLLGKVLALSEKNPRAALTSGGIVIIYLLFQTVQMLFVRTDEREITAQAKYDKKEAKLEEKNESLQNENDSLRTLVGLVRAEGMAKELAAKDAASKDLAELNNSLKRTTYELEQQLKDLRKTTGQNRVLTETIVKQSNQ